MFLRWFFDAANFALMAAKTGKEKRVNRTFSGMRISTLNWFQQRADEADLPLSKYINLLLDAIKNDAENKVEGGGGNRTRSFLSTWFADTGRRAVSERRAA